MLLASFIICKARFVISSVTVGLLPARSGSPRIGAGRVPGFR
jgi:hypothetical protein